MAFRSKWRQRKLKDQVIVITGASSGIGLSTARLAAKRGAKVVVCSRNEDELRRLVREVEEHGGQAACYVADVGDEKAMEDLADAAIERFGRIDTWVNNAGVTAYGKLTQTKMSEKKRVFETNFWGAIYGCRAALPHLKKRGGVIINIGSVASEVAIPLQGIYSASKHALKGYTDALRMELEMDRIPVAISLINPGSIDTPYTVHAKNHLGKEAVLPPPVYAPEIVARAILSCAVKPVRKLYVGGAAKALASAEKLAPRFVDYYEEQSMDARHQSLDRPAPREDALFSPPTHEGAVRGNYPGHVMRTSAYTTSVLHPIRLAVSAVGVLGAVGWMVSRARRESLSRSDLMIQMPEKPEFASPNM